MSCNTQNTYINRQQKFHVEILSSTHLFVKLDVVVVFARAKGIRLIDLCRLWQFTVGFEISRFVCRVLLNDVRLVVLEFAEREENNVTLVDPDLQLCMRDLARWT